jgi:hypothetical protein
MNVTYKTTPSEESKQMLESLRKAVAKALEKKRRLGQYAVVWRDGKPVFIGEDAPETKDNQNSRECDRPHFSAASSP